MLGVQCRWAAVAVGILTAACSGSTDGETHPDDLSGTWDAIGTDLGRWPTAVTVTLTSQEVRVVSEGGSAFLVRQGDEFLGSYAGKDLRARRNNPGDGAFGIFPIDVSGSWSIGNPLSTPNAGCSWSLTDGSGNGSCSNANLPDFLFDAGFDDGFAVATRLGTLASRFGDLGGDWKVDLSGGGTCMARFEGDKITASCAETRGGLSGQIALTFGNGVMSGVTSAGIEFSAQRR